MTHIEQQQNSSTTMQTPEKNAPKNLVPRSKAILISYCIMFAVALIFSIGAQFAIPLYETVFSSFGADLPWLTSIVVDYRKWLLLMPIYMSVIVIFFMVQSRVTTEMNHAFKIIFFADLLTFIGIAATVVVAMYLPLFKMGAVA